MNFAQRFINTFWGRFCKPSLKIPNIQPQSCASRQTFQFQGRCLRSKTQRFSSCRSWPAPRPEQLLGWSLCKDRHRQSIKQQLLSWTTNFMCVRHCRSSLPSAMSGAQQTVFAYSLSPRPQCHNSHSGSLLSYQCNSNNAINATQTINAIT